MTIPYLGGSTVAFLPLQNITRIVERVGTDSKYTPVLFELTFVADPEEQQWKLLVGPMATMYLARHWDVTTSVGAIELLVLCGIYYHTALPIPRDSLPAALQPP